ncbi:MAG TPA: DUF2336 domain-containing protein [Sphingomicrobium sp.]|nr:DUF2336 domain-containing protein [Sphingomicrobium sp.]
MMAEEWPIGAAAADPARAPARGEGERLATVRADFFLSPAARLTEQERALMTAMLHCLVGDIADELRAALPSGSAAANDQDNIELIERLTEARLLDRGALVRLLLRRADEERISTAAKARSGRREARVLQGLVSHHSGAISAAAMALILARGRRRDRFGQCLLHFDDLPPAEAAALAEIVAAGLRANLILRNGAADTDRWLGAAVGELMSRYDRGNGIEELSAILVDLLEDEGELGDELIVSAAMEGEMTFVAQALARRSGLNGEVATDELLSSSEQRVMTLLRIAGVRRELAAGLLAGIGDLLGVSDPGRAIAAFDGMSEAEVDDARSWLSADPLFRTAVSRIENA